MPRGDNPNSRNNLIKNSDLTPTERRKRASKAGKRSAEVRREYASLTEAARGIVGAQERDELITMLYRMAKSGNLKAYELLRDQLGEKPVEKIQVAQIDTGTVEEIDNLINGIIEQSTEND